MRLSDKARCLVFILVLMSVLGAFLITSSIFFNVPMRTVGAPAAHASASTTVHNTITVLSSSVSLGSSLRVEGVVATPNGPIADLPVALHVGDIIVARTSTDDSGIYFFSAPVGLNYIPAVFSGSANVYTVTEPIGSTYPAAPSAVTVLPVDPMPAYSTTASVTGVVVLGLYLYTRTEITQRQSAKTRLLGLRLPKWTRNANLINCSHRLAALQLPSWAKRVQRQKEHADGVTHPIKEQTASVDLAAPITDWPTEDLTQKASTTSPAPAAYDDQETEYLIDEAVQHQEVYEAELAQADAEKEESEAKSISDLFADGEDRQAVNALYDKAVPAFANVCGITLSANMSRREMYEQFRNAAPDVRSYLFTLTEAYEITAYGGKSLTAEQRAAATEAYHMILQYATNLDNTSKELLDSPETSVRPESLKSETVRRTVPHDNTPLEPD